jgi:imidazolonepropionase-like amidohydrolase
VQTTLVVYDATGGPGKRALMREPALSYLTPDTQARWRPFMRPGPPGYRYASFMKAVAASLHDAGVLLVAGTDAMGYPLVVPGASLLRELELLVEVGLSPYEALYAATIAPASFIGRPRDFGIVEAGSRADLILVDGNPLEDVRHLRKLRGVMARGKWFSVDDLDHRIASPGSP